MKVLLDTCVWGGAVKDLRSAGHDVIWAGEWEEDPGDEQILPLAHGEGLPRSNRNGFYPVTRGKYVHHGTSGLLTPYLNAISLSETKSYF